MCTSAVPVRYHSVICTYILCNEWEISPGPVEGLDLETIAYGYFLFWCRKWKMENTPVTPLWICRLLKLTVFLLPNLTYAMKTRGVHKADTKVHRY